MTSDPDLDINVEQYLIVHTDQYTGNWDSFLTGLLFGADDDRYGCEAGMKLYVGFPANEVELRNHPDAYNGHNVPYATTGAEHKSLSFALDHGLSETQRNHLMENYLNKPFVWDRGVITITGFTDHKVKIEKTHRKVRFF